MPGGSRVVAERMARLLKASSDRIDTERTIRLRDADTVAPATVPLPEPAPLPRLDLGESDDVELRIERLLGRGGMGQVQLARQRSLDREVAVKRPLPDRSNELVAQSLLDEGRVTGKLEHPSIVPVHMLGLDERGQPVVVMKRIEGVSWRALIDDPRHAAWQSVRTLSEQPLYRHVEILLQVCSAIRFAHARGVVHRDIKPDNVMIGSFGEIYVLDWGVAVPRRTAAYAHVAPGAESLPLGTPGYMAPEMLATDGVLDERTDVYLLAATLHQALTGEVRHGGDDIIDVFHSALVSAPYAYGSEIPEALAAICNRAMAQEADDRYASVDDFANALAEFLRHQGSMRLAGEAAARLAELETVLREADALPQAQKLFSESRFGFQQALREWPDNGEARRGMRRAIELMARAMIAHDNLETAEVLAAELDEPIADLSAAIATARERKLSEREQVDDLRRRAHELDADVSVRARAAVSVGFGVVGTSVALFLPNAAPSSKDGLVAVACFVLALTVFVIAFRRRVLANAANRRIVALLYLVLVAVSGHHVLRLLAGTPDETLVPINLWICAVVMVAGAITVDRRVALQAALFIAGTVVALRLPTHAVRVTQVTVVAACTFGVAAWFLPRWRNK